MKPMPKLSVQETAQMRGWLDLVAGDGLAALRARRLAEDARIALEQTLPRRAVLLCSVSAGALLSGEA